MTKHLTSLFVVAAAALWFAPASVHAGTEIEAAPDKKVIVPTEKTEPTGMLTLGVKASGDLTSGYVDALTPVWNPGDFHLFLNTRGTYNSDDQLLSSYGVAGRYLVPGHDVILGVNAYYDSINSMNGHDFDQLGLGAEVLTHWIDARFNYYAPEAEKFEVESHTDRSSSARLGPVFKNRINPRLFFLQQQRFGQAQSRTTRTVEAALEGWNAEIGFLIPGLDKYMEVRAFVGAYGYNNPFGKDFVGLKGRIEARPLPGVIAGVEYWEDAYMTGGHWTGELAVSVPFSIYNLASGRNPFEGFGEAFRPRQREFNERLSDLVMRSHRVMTVTGTETADANSFSKGTATEGSILLKPVVKPAGGTPPPPQVGQGEGG